MSHHPTYLNDKPKKHSTTNKLTDMVLAADWSLHFVPDNIIGVGVVVVMATNALLPLILGFL